MLAINIQGPCTAHTLVAGASSTGVSWLARIMLLPELPMF